jgi:hypothetical protein
VRSHRDSLPAQARSPQLQQCPTTLGGG